MCGVGAVRCLVNLSTPELHLSENGAKTKMKSVQWCQLDSDKAGAAVVPMVLSIQRRVQNPLQRVRHVPAERLGPLVPEPKSTIVTTETDKPVVSFFRKLTVDFFNIPSNTANFCGVGHCPCDLNENAKKSRFQIHRSCSDTATLQNPPNTSPSVVTLRLQYLACP